MGRRWRIPDWALEAYFGRPNATYKGRRPGTRRVVIWAKGKAHEWVVTGTKAEAEAFEARKRLELQADQLSARTAPTFCDFCLQKYQPYAETNLKESTWRKSRKYQVANLIEFFGSMRLTAIDTGVVEDFKSERIDEVGRTTVNNELRLLGTILRYGRELGFPCGTPKIVKLKVGERRVRAWTRDELELLFVKARSISVDLQRMIIFLVNTGCRKGEAIAAEWDWIDFDAGMIRIPSNEYWQPKNGKPREVPMSDACRAILSLSPKSDRWVFPNRSLRRYAEFPKDLFWDARDAAGLTGGVHQLRHTFASHFLQEVPDLFLLAQVLGHSHQRTTELYAHLLPGHLERARNAVNLGPKLETMVRTMATPRKPRRSAGKTR